MRLARAGAGAADTIGWRVRGWVQPRVRRLDTNRDDDQIMGSVRTRTPASLRSSAKVFESSRQAQAQAQAQARAREWGSPVYQIDRKPAKSRFMGSRARSPRWRGWTTSDAGRAPRP